MLSPSKISTMLFALNNKTSWNWTHIWSPERRKRKHKTKHIQTHQTQTTNMSKLYNLLISSRFRFFFSNFASSLFAPQALNHWGQQLRLKRLDHFLELFVSGQRKNTKSENNNQSFRNITLLLVSGGFQQMWKIWIKNWNLHQVGVKNNKDLKPPPSFLGKSPCPDLFGMVTSPEINWWIGDLQLGDKKVTTWITWAMSFCYVFSYITGIVP